MRERTPFPASLLARLPKLKLLVTTGHYNAAIDTVPAVFIAGMFGFDKRDFFEVEDEARVAPEVQLR